MYEYTFKGEKKLSTTESVVTITTIQINAADYFEGFFFFFFAETTVEKLKRNQWII